MILPYKNLFVQRKKSPLFFLFLKDNFIDRDTLGCPDKLESFVKIERWFVIGLGIDSDT
jgi:hypothetical protein